MEKRVDNTSWRFERKYALTLREYLQFEKLLLHSDVEMLFPDRQINNCYFDTINNNAYTESIEGFSEKMKVRIRWYGDLYTATTPVLEFKIKQNHSNKKELFNLFETNITKDFNWKLYAAQVLDFISQQYKLTIPNRFEPVLINSYRRSYYTNFEKSFRLTVDDKLSYMSPFKMVDPFYAESIERYILELKSNNESILKDFPINKNLGKFSKFTNGIELIR